MLDPNGIFVSEQRDITFKQFRIPVPIHAIIARHGAPESAPVSAYAVDVVYDISVNGVEGRLATLEAYPEFYNPYVTGIKINSRDTVVFKNPLYDTVIPEPLPEGDMYGFGGDVIMTFDGAPIAPFNT